MQSAARRDYFGHMKMRLDDFAAVRLTAGHGQISFEEEIGGGGTFRGR
jgi:hypothetical protein